MKQNKVINDYDLLGKSERSVGRTMNKKLSQTRQEFSCFLKCSPMSKLVLSDSSLSGYPTQKGKTARKQEPAEDLFLTQTQLVRVLTNEA